jgi:hypothetical protein
MLMALDSRLRGIDEYVDGFCETLRRPRESGDPAALMQKTLDSRFRGNDVVDGSCVSWASSNRGGPGVSLNGSNRTEIIHVEPTRRS